MNPLKAANPITVTKGAVGLAGTVARGAVHAPVDLTRGAFHLAGLAGGVARETAHALWTDPEVEHVAPRPSEGPTVVLAEPHAPEEPPIDVVGAALEAEAAAERGEGPGGAGMAHEPHAASRDEGHGAAALQRATIDEIAEETEAALEGDVEPEEHLTAPLLDSSDAKAVAAELRTMSKAADPDKG